MPYKDDPEAQTPLDDDGIMLQQRMMMNGTCSPPRYQFILVSKVPMLLQSKMNTWTAFRNQSPDNITYLYKSMMNWTFILDFWKN